MLLGGMRTYARLQPEEGFNYKNWVEAVRAGRTFVTNGPLLSFDVDGREPGSAVQPSASSPTVRVRAEARSVVPFDRLELLANGKVVAETAAGSPTSAVLETNVPLPTAGWLAARCRGEHQLLHRPANQRAFAHTSPVYVQTEGQPAPVDTAVLNRFVAELARILDWVAREARCENERQRERLVEVFRVARQELLRRCSVV
jgi:hypothetical protein